MHRTRLLALLTLLVVSSLPTPTSAARPRDRVDLVIRGGTVVTVDGQDRVIPNGAVAVQGERIVAVDTADAIASRLRR